MADRRRGKTKKKEVNKTASTTANHTLKTVGRFCSIDVQGTVIIYNDILYRVYVTNKSLLQELHDKPTPEQYAVAKYLRFNLPAKEAKLVGMTVQYFIGRLHH